MKSDVKSDVKSERKWRTMTVRQWLKGIGDDMAMARQVERAWDEAAPMALDAYRGAILRSAVPAKSAPIVHRPVRRHHWPHVHVGGAA